MNNTCTQCGVIFDNPGVRLLCDDCLALSRENSTVRSRVCRNCGTAFPGGPRAWYCPECRAERKRKADAEYHRTGAMRKLGSTDICAACGGEYIVESSHQKYCPRCAETSTRAEVSRQKKEIPRHTVQQYHARRSQRIRPCKACGMSFHPDGPKQYCSPACKAYGKYLSQSSADYERGRNRRPPLSYEEYMRIIWRKKNEG